MSLICGSRYRHRFLLGSLSGYETQRSDHIGRHHNHEGLNVVTLNIAHPAHKWGSDQKQQVHGHGGKSQYLPKFYGWLGIRYDLLKVKVCNKL